MPTVVFFGAVSAGSLLSSCPPFAQVDLGPTMRAILFPAAQIAVTAEADRRAKLGN